MIDAEAGIRSVAAVGEDTVAVEIETPAGFDPHPGQFVKLTAFVDGDHVTRFYTLSSPDAVETFEVTVKIESDGTLGPWLRSAAGETVQIEGPYGNAYYAGEPRTLVLGAGPGIGPAVGIGERAIQDGNEIAIVYYENGQIPHRDRLDQLGTDGAAVSITTELQSSVATHLDEEVHLLVYGFQDFVTEALEAIEAAGGDPDRAFVENFG